MDKVYEELDEAKAKIEELKEELRAKTDSLENWKKSHNAQINQIQEAKFKAEKLDQTLLQQADEISEAKLVCEDLKGKLTKKESIIKHLRAANDKLRVDCDAKFKKWEEEKRELVLALEEGNEKTQDHEQQIHQYKQEIERLKGCLSVSKEKCVETEKKFKASKELRERDDMFQKLEEECRKAEDQLKWKKEQFKHLEEAHEKLRDQFKASKKEAEVEKSTLLDGISSLQTRLDSQIRVSEDLQHQLHTCHQALAHVESQKKCLEVEVSNLKVQLDNASNEYQDARLQLDCLNTHCDKDIADLRYLLKTKEAYNKESKYRIEKLEQENQELRMSLKELQEAQIQEAGTSYSQSKLRSKLRNLEQTHKECASTLKTKEAEWNFKIKQLTENLNRCQSDLETKIEAVEDLQMELERSHSLAIEMMLLNEEISVMLLVLKQGTSEAQLKLAGHKDEMDLISKASEEKIFQLMRQLEMKDAALISAQKSINEEREIAARLMKQVESSVSNNELHSLQNELDRHKEMLEESIRSQLILKENVLQMECNFKEQLEMKDVVVISAQKSINEEREVEACLRRQVESYASNNDELQQSLQNEVDRHKEMQEESTSQPILKEKVLQLECNFKEQLKEIHDAFDSVIIELDETICERNEMEFELQIWKSIVEHLKNDLEENHVVRRELESSLLAQVDFGESLKHEKDSLVYKLEEKERSLDYLQRHVVLLERELIERGESAVSSESDNVRYLQIIAEKDKILEELQKEVVWLEQESFRKEFESAVIEKGTMERTFEHEKDNLIQIVKGKDRRIDELMQQVTSLEQQFTNSLTTFSSQLAEKQAEINLIQEACYKITTSQILAALEIEEKKFMVVELEDDIHAIQQKLKLQEEKWSPSEQLALDTEVELGAKQLKAMELNDQMESKLRKSDALLHKLKMENRNLLESATRLSSERESLLANVQGFSDKICEFSTADTILMDKLRSMVQSFENGCPVMKLKKDDGFLVKENNMLIQSPTRIKKLEANSDTRSPFKELNLLEE
ncbi:hypothetical protein GLYMA_18G147000v4 [Glycine max]|uniref:Uncharacterized protein n=1 Tax=Glycine max TaxID=3847 RepID=I1N1V5_SOYBN|nr:uncharacterized protein At4g38062 [Glycine max]KAG4921439.1 hypothetical protein JHK86_050252 [Glycine max]KAG5094725.1 hypothetical protein JHK84_050313 [Glycine max]KAH1154578.1 hypothetical protein GYH30_050025 [Glycine max]KRG99464.1 hypothetical protein GLYMA_18G147000v4 [Glycine max]|eukprot:XP_006602451.1 uncharacterized protein At4g38062 [Glycine max]